jgi:hypothetical protein
MVYKDLLDSDFTGKKVTYIGKGKYNLRPLLFVKGKEIKHISLPRKSLRTQVKYKVVSGEYKCCYCEIPLDRYSFTKEHLVPVSRGGTDRVSNLRAACEDCNQEKGNLMLYSYIVCLELSTPDFVPNTESYFTHLTKIRNAKRLLDELESLHSAR